MFLEIIIKIFPKYINKIDLKNICRRQKIKSRCNTYYLINDTYCGLRENSI